MTKNGIGEVVTIKTQAYKLVCQECGEIFYSENPRMKKCNKCKSEVIHRRCKKYYEEVLKDKRKQARAERKGQEVTKICCTCGKEFKTTNGRQKQCSACAEKRDKISNTKVAKKIKK